MWVQRKGHIVERILRDINAVGGVIGCFVCDSQGKMLSSTLTGLYDQTTLTTVGGIMAQTLAAVGIVTRRRKIGDIEMVYDQGCLIAKALGNGCLYIFCKRNINVSLLNLTANVAARKLSAIIKEG